MIDSIIKWISSLVSELEEFTQNPSSSSSYLFTSVKPLEEIKSIINDLEETKQMCEGINAALVDAEMRQIGDETIGVWLHDLRVWVEKAENLMDEYEYQRLASEASGESRITSIFSQLPFVSFIWTMATGEREPKKKFGNIGKKSAPMLVIASFRQELANRIRELKQQFGNIAKRRNALRLTDAVGSRPFDDPFVDRSPSGFIPEDRTFLGRANELWQLKELLLGGSSNDGENIEVVAVIGMGGIGKTTLAQHVYSDPVIETSFKRGWVSVGESFDVAHLLKASIESLSRNASNLTEVSTLQDELKGRLVEDGKKVLLVLDDVWNEDTEKWATFIAPFDHGTPRGSKILLTTRLDDVARTSRVVNPIRPKGLSKDEGWSLLREHAFGRGGGQNENINVSEEFKEIGKEIVRKCQGLPFAIKVLGGLINSMGSDQEDNWKYVKESSLSKLKFGEGRKRILGSLYLSYLHLRPQLKTCFRFCSICCRLGLREDSTLKLFLMCFDIVKDDRDAENCLRELKSRSFLESIVSRPFRDHKIIIGREEELHELFQMLLGESSNDGDNIEAVAVIGMGGIGKTTLAQLAYNHQFIATSFKRVWLSVAERFDVAHLLKAAIEHLSGDECNLIEVSNLQDELKRKLVENKEKVLIVLDDVWNEDTEKWKTFSSPLLLSAKRGSRILITTRAENVARVSGVVVEKNSITLRGLSKVDSWRLLREHASGHGYRQFYNIDNKEEMWKEIVTKCEGSPLKIMLLGRMLYRMGSDHLSDSWENDSMHDLLHDHLSDSWENVSMHDLLHDHLSDSWENVSMHDLLHDLAEYVFKDKHIIMDGSSDSWNASGVRKTYDIAEADVRHRKLSSLRFAVVSNLKSETSVDVGPKLQALYTNDLEGDFELLEGIPFEDLKRLRVLSLSKKSLDFTARSQGIPEEMFQLYNLRYLKLTGSSITFLPDSLGNLRNLRWLNLSYNPQMDNLPESISRLVNLQELDVTKTSMDSFPEGITNLTNLLRLNFDVGRFSHMPTGFGNLRNLQKLTGFVVGSSAGQANIAELKHMLDLKDGISLQNLRHVKSAADAKEAGMKDKKHILRLRLCFGEEVEAAVSVQEQVMDCLRPHRNLEELSVIKHQGSKLPSWMGDDSFTKLVHINLRDIPYCTSLSPVDQLPSLVELRVDNMKRLSQVVSDGNDGSLRANTERRRPFPKLQKLYIGDCNNLRFLSLHDFDAIRRVEVQYCHNLEGMDPPSNDVSSLESVTIWSCPLFRYTPNPARPINWVLAQP